MDAAKKGDKDAVKPVFQCISEYFRGSWKHPCIQTSLKTVSRGYIGVGCGLFLGFTAFLILTRGLIGFPAREPESLTHGIKLGFLALMQLALLASLKIDDLINHSGIQLISSTIESWTDAAIRPFVTLIRLSGP